MELTSHQLANYLLGLPDKPFTISVDISTGEDNASDRVFTEEFTGINNKEGEELVLLFSGKSNNEGNRITSSKYKKGEYCKSINCAGYDDLMSGNQEFCKKNCVAYKFHNYLIDHGYEIIKLIKEDKK